MSRYRVLSNQKHLVSFTVLVILSLFLPVGIRYATHIVPGREEDLRVQIEFIPPFLIWISQGDWTVRWFMSALGILIPFFLIIHLLLVWQIARISRGQKELASIIYNLVAVLLISLIAFFPTFQLDRGNIPLPLMLPVGLAFAKFLAAPPINSPFDEQTAL